MPDPLDDILALVAEGRLTAEEAAPIVAALESARSSERAADQRAARDAGQAPSGGGRTVRLEVTEDGRRVVNLRLPAGLGERALQGIPGLSETQAGRIRSALADGVRGTIFEALHDGDGVRIVID